jgi:hypothetical protein
MHYTQGIVEESCLVFCFDLDTDGFGWFRHDVNVMYGLLFVKENVRRDYFYYPQLFAIQIKFVWLLRAPLSLLSQLTLAQDTDTFRL